MKRRILIRSFRGAKTVDGAGVSLVRIFGQREAVQMDPFLLFDVFGGSRPEDYLAGFPRHPHRGMETVTYMLDGRVKHGDSLGNSGIIGPGDLQWMSAGSGIIHEEMPQLSPLGVRGFQLWINLPRAEKFRDPAYLDAAAGAVPVVAVDGGELRVLAGEFRGVLGPIAGIARNPAYFDLRLKPGTVLDLETPADQTAFAYLYDGGLADDGTENSDDRRAGACRLYGPGDFVRFAADQSGCRLVFARAAPLHEPIAWGGPIVMNTKQELEQAFDEYERGVFVKLSEQQKNSPAQK